MAIAIQPDAVPSDWIGRGISVMAKGFGASDEVVRKRLLAKVLIRRMVGPLGIANMALFCVTGNGRNISGHPLLVCGKPGVMG